MVHGRAAKEFETAGANSSSRNEYYLGGVMALLLQDHRTMLQCQ